MRTRDDLSWNNSAADRLDSVRPACLVDCQCLFELPLYSPPETIVDDFREMLSTRNLVPNCKMFTDGELNVDLHDDCEMSSYVNHLFIDNNLFSRRYLIISFATLTFNHS